MGVMPVPPAIMDRCFALCSSPSSVYLQATAGRPFSTLPAYVQSSANPAEGMLS